jgi:hypothetical protein
VAEAGFSGSRGEDAVKVTQKKEGKPHFNVSEYGGSTVRHPCSRFCSYTESYTRNRPTDFSHESCR